MRGYETLGCLSLLLAGVACAEASGSLGYGPDGAAGSGSAGAPPFNFDAGSISHEGGDDCGACAADQVCVAGECLAACEAARVTQSSVGCDYYATAMATVGAGFGGCFVAFVANTWNKPVKISASFAGKTLDLGAHAAIPKGSGPSLTYLPYDAVNGVPPGEVAILFLANDPVPHGTWQAPAACPVPAAVGLDAHVHWGLSINTGRGRAFHITTDAPVVAYQMLPYNAAHSTTSGATLLIPTSAWDTNYIAVQAWSAALFQGLPLPPSMALVAQHDGTTVTIVPTNEIKSGLDVPGIGKNQVGQLKLDAGETIEFIQQEELTGSAIQSDKPIAVFAGHSALRIPADVDYSDHAEQQIPPVRALGSEYAVASYRDRVPGFAENRVHRLIGAADGTLLSFDPPIPGAPTSLELGSVASFVSDQPFVVRSQDEKHPFLAFTYMSSSGNIAEAGGPAGYGDPEFVRVVAGLQYLKRYVFFTDPTYPETNLVVVRRKGATGFANVELDCKGTLDGWQPIGSGSSYQFTRVDLSRGNFQAQGACDNGRREMTSTEPFGLWVWGWGSPETRPGQAMPCDNTKSDNSCDVSYGYPAGESIATINPVVIKPVPR